LAGVKVETFDEVTAPLERPMHVTRFSTTPGPGAGAMVFDAAASGFLLDGVLGGSGVGALPALNPTGLSGPQAALLSGLASNILRAFSTSLNACLGIGLDGRSVGSPAGADAVSLACELAVETPHGTARIVLVIPADALATRNAAPPPEAAGDPRVARLMDDVELDLVVELGRVALPIGRMAVLAVGDTLRLDVPVAGLVSIRAGEQELMHGRPTSSAGRIAVKIVAP
jgi:flagellar motor switch protein FliM